jgi:Tol biopolymer transport system component
MADDAQDRLDSWKEIGTYLQRDLRTARRWEKEEGLPVHRHSHRNRATVYAYRSEIDAWRASRRVVTEPPPPLPLWKTLLTGPRPLAFILTVALCLITVGAGVRPQVASAKASVETRRVWAKAKGRYDAVSPDGQFVIFLDNGTGNVAVHDVAAMNDRLLTHTGDWSRTDGSWAGRSTFSADGSQVAYGWGTPQGVQLRTLALRGTETGPPRIIRQSSEDGSIAPFGWSPDGKRVYVERILKGSRIVQLAVVSIQDGSLRVLKSLSWLSVQAKLSPDGRSIAYDLPVGDGAPSSDIAVLASDGSQESIVVQHPAKDFDPMWSPDGKRVLFLSDRTGRTALWSVAVENGKAQGSPELVRADVGRILPLNITRDGTLYYWTSDQHRNLYSVDVDGNLRATKAPVPVTDRFVNSNFHASWSPDGERLAYYSLREGAYERFFGNSALEVQTVLVIRSVRSGEERDIHLPLQILAYPQAAEPKWFPDGRSVLVEGWVAQTPALGYYRVDLTTGKTELLLRPSKSSAHLDLSPDGRFIWDSLYTLRCFDIKSRQQVDISKLLSSFPNISKAHRGQFALSPDGKQIAVAYPIDGTLNGPDDVYIVPITGGKARLVSKMRNGPDNESGNTLAWTPDQRFLVYAQRDKDGTRTSLWRVPVTGGAPQRVGVSTSGRFKTPRVQPGGRKIVYETIEGSLWENSELWALENFLPRTEK